MRRIFLLILLFSMLISCQKQNSSYRKLRGRGFFYEKNRSFEAIPIKVNIAPEIHIASESRYNISSPFFASSYMERFVSRAIHGTLLMLDPSDGSYISNIATYQLIDSKIVLELSNSFKFSNGKSVTPDDVVASLNFFSDVLFDSEYHDKYFSYDKSPSFSLVGKTLEVDTTLGQADVMRFLSEFPILQSEELERYVDYQMLSLDTQFVGCGPYRVSNRSASSVVLQANEHYYKKDVLGNSFPYTKTIVLRYYDTTQELVQDYMQGNVDLFRASVGEVQMLQPVLMNENTNMKALVTGLSSRKIVTVYNGFADNSRSYMKERDVRAYLSEVVSNVATDSPLSEVTDFIGGKTFCGINFSRDDFDFEAGCVAYKGESLSIRAFVYSDDIDTRQRLSTSLKAVFDDEHIKCSVSTIDSSADFYECVYSGEYDLMLVDYDVSNLSRAKMNEEFSMLFDMRAPASFMNSDDYQDYIDSEIQFAPVIERSECYLIKSTLENFFYNAKYSTEPDLKSIEYMFVEMNR